MSYRSIGRKIRRSVDVIGKKIKQGQRVGMKVGRNLDVGGRKVGNTARRAGRALEKVSQRDIVNEAKERLQGEMSNFA